MSSATNSEPVPQTFADFLYAVVIGVAFSDLKVSALDEQLLGGAFLLIVVLEDFFLYQTQIKPKTNLYKFASFRSLFFELAILLSWFFAFKVFADSKLAGLLGLSVFFFFKFLATAIRLPKAKATDRPFLYRDFTFLLPVLGLGALALMVDLGLCTSIGRYVWLWAFAIWLVQTVIWWGVAKLQDE